MFLLVKKFAQKQLIIGSISPIDINSYSRSFKSNLNASDRNFSYFKMTFDHTSLNLIVGSIIENKNVYHVHFSK